MKHESKVSSGSSGRKRFTSTLWLVTVHFPSSHRSVRRFLVQGKTRAIAERAFAAANVAAACAVGLPFVGPQNTVEWTALRDDGVIELPEVRYL